MKKYSFHNVLLKHKLLLIYFLCVFIPILLTNIVFYHVTINHVKKQKMHDLTLAFQQIEADFIHTVDEAIGVSTTIYTDSILHQFLEKEYESPIEYINDYETIFRNFSKYSPVYSSIQQITFFTDNETMLFAGGIKEIVKDAETSPFYKELFSINEPYPKLKRDDDTNTFSIVRELNYFQQNEREKYVKIDLNFEMIQHALENATFQGELYLLSDTQQIEYSTNPSSSYKQLHQLLYNNNKSEETILFEREFDLNYLSNWKLVGIVSEKAIIEEVQHSRQFILYLVAFNFFVPSLIIMWISSSLHTRILRILRHMKRIKNQNFEQIPGVEYQDEIGQLTSEFNRMAKKINDLINDVYIANIQKKDLELKRKQAQLSALQSQINPHFLFNALETIRMRSLLKQEEETANIIQNMAKLLRNSISNGKDWVTVNEELILVKSFLEIQQYRFGEKLSYQISSDDEYKDLQIPYMSIIPFVENASIHGIEPKREKGSIQIVIKKKKRGIVCTIEDDGVGMENGKLEHLVNSLKRKEEMANNIGVKNVYYRLQLLYGEKFDFKLLSSLDKGTKVEIYFPNRNEI
ncbi:sensor histidine kinase [Alkalihalobacillus sp. LMS39]|uniref:sensor histidine kinase n=1 Tax=Alkalihalobacillus sp. LMS39 TaxID=2924032 RepID=UPI001FB311B6|nr:sensor histidine kinase [Alkalihalobacillus sp. LMS39]UOE93579.1 sensor histidine kinase [Alkalihalobacillus sp. LMS39]